MKQSILKYAFRTGVHNVPKIILLLLRHLINLSKLNLWKESTISYTPTEIY